MVERFLQSMKVCVQKRIEIAREKEMPMMPVKRKTTSWSTLPRVTPEYNWPIMHAPACPQPRKA